MTISRRTALLALATLVLSTSACSSEPPMDEAEVNQAVAQVEGVTSVNIKVEEGGGVSGWSLRGEIGLPDDQVEARTVYENSLRAIASIPVPGQETLGIYVHGVSAAGSISPRDIDIPDNTTQLKKHFN